jgi:hypothetical protein
MQTGICTQDGPQLFQDLTPNFGVYGHASQYGNLNIKARFDAKKQTQDDGE